MQHLPTPTPCLTYVSRTCPYVPMHHLCAPYMPPMCSLYALMCPLYTPYVPLLALMYISCALYMFQPYAPLMCSYVHLHTPYAPLNVSCRFLIG